MPTLPLHLPLPCSRCSYDLRGRDLASRCPECNHLVQDSKETFTRLMDPRHARLLNLTAVHAFLLGTAPAWIILALAWFEIRNPFPATLSLSVLGIFSILLWRAIAPAASSMIADHASAPFSMPQALC